MENKSKKLDFTGQNIYIGLDTHLKSWTTSIVVENTFFKKFSQPPKAEVLNSYLQKNFPGANYFSAYEASFSGFSAHRELNNLNIKNIVVNPADIPTTDKEKKQKDDARDSKKIAEQLSYGGLKGIYIPDIETEGDRSLLRFRKTLTKEIAKNKNRVKSLLYYNGITIPADFADKKYWSKRFSRWLLDLELDSSGAKVTLTEMVEIVEYLRKKQYQILKKIKELSKTEKYRENIELLLSVPGIGLITAMSFLSEIDDILRFNTLDKLCSFVGLVPMTKSSGEKESVGGITKRQNKMLRSLIIESSWIAIRNDPALLMAYQKLIKRMKPQKAIIRIAKKLLNRMRYVLNNKKKYEFRTV